MTARLFPVSSEVLPSAKTPRGCYPSNTRSAYRGSDLKPNLSENYLGETSMSDQTWNVLMDIFSEGVMVISRNLKPIYLNSQAKELCRKISTDQQITDLPIIISEICHRLLKKQSVSNYQTVVECQTSDGQTVRLQARWFNSQPNSNAAQDSTPFDWSYQRQFILVLLENRDAILEEELQIEQRKYDLTERETEIWMLLRQECSYQEIAKTLQISLNTVKTHVKNVYAKKRSYQGRDKVVIF